MKQIIFSFLLCLALAAQAQTQALPKVYDESVEPMAQIDAAVKAAADGGRHVICQVGGNWCRWCLMFADFITKDEEIAAVVRDNYVYIHVNYPVGGNKNSEGSLKLMERLKNVGRLGFPAFAVLDASGNLLHQQDSSFLEEGQGYSHDKVLRFLQSWTPAATK